ncbi:hypothetical protein [Methanoculleus taiwanensis]|uniref:hypothetical protein n=1 Tax=Methanoculleus taiwanensis TaxID=1550565 RepID=UPI000FFEAA10|nr:hypothetical protein [Methanoculleus taiwanensis]
MRTVSTDPPACPPGLMRREGNKAAPYMPEGAGGVSSGTRGAAKVLRIDLRDPPDDAGCSGTGASPGGGEGAGPPRAGRGVHDHAAGGCLRVSRESAS